MALIDCPHCGNKISTSARKCPQCGTILNRVSKPVEVAPVHPVIIAEEEQSQQPATAQMQQPEKAVTEQAVITTATTESKKHSWLWVTIVALVALILGGGGSGYWYYQNIYLPEKIDREAPRTFPMVNVQLRSSKMAGGDFNKLLTIPFGGELITYSSDNEWAKVKYIEPSSDTKTEGYVASPYLLDRKDFYILNSLLGDNDVREIVATAKVRRALLDYYKANNYVGKISDDLLAEVGLSATPEQQWQIVFHHGQAKPNEILFKRLTNDKSKYTDMAVLIENINTHTRKVLFFKFDDDETPHLVFEGDAPAEGDIKDVMPSKREFNDMWSPFSYTVVYTTDIREYTAKE